MKIKKLIKCINVFSYASFEWDAINPLQLSNKDGQIVASDSCFKECNILFGENGNGKSKFVKVLKALNDKSQAIEKHRDLRTEPQEISIELDDSSIIGFANETWSGGSLEDKIIVFDKDFIDTFVHSSGSHDGDTPQRRQQRGKSIVLLGDFGEYNKEIEKVNGVKRSVVERNEKFIKDESALVSLILKAADKDIDWLKQNKDKAEKIDSNKMQNLLEQQEDLSQKINTLLKVKKESQEVDGLETLDERKDNFAFPTEEEHGSSKNVNPAELFSFSVTGGIQSTIEKITGKENFISEGISFFDNNGGACPFCTQKITGEDSLELIENYKTVFTKEFNENKQRVQDLLLDYKTTLSSALQINNKEQESEKLKKQNYSFRILAIYHLFHCLKKIFQLSKKRLI